MQRAPASPYPQPKAASVGDKLSLAKAVLLFLLPFASLVQVQVVGTLYGLDILLGLTLLVTLANRNSPKALGQMKWVLTMLAVWFLGAILSDWWVAAPFQDWSRGMAKLLFFAIALMAIWLLTGGRARELSIMMGGFGLATIVGVWVSPSEFAEQDPWKFGIGGGLMYLTVFAPGSRDIWAAGRGRRSWFIKSDSELSIVGGDCDHGCCLFDLCHLD